MKLHQRLALGFADVVAVAIGVALAVPFFLVAFSPFIVG